MTLLGVKVSWVQGYTSILWIEAFVLVTELIMN